VVIYCNLEEVKDREEAGGVVYLEEMTERE
jgi:hypothetical protein